MKIELPLIFWHGNRDRIMSIDFYPNSNYLITCGAESEDKMWIKLWEIEELEHSEIPSTNTETNPFKSNKQNPFVNDKDKENSMQLDDVGVGAHQARIKPKFLYDISGAHTATVNVVRFSPNGMFLASGGDDSAIVIWVQKSRPVEFGSTIEKVTWSNHKILRGHLSDIYDLSWSPDSKFLISGSVDNSAIIWNVDKAKGVQKLTDHSHFVQGVSWDPRNKYIVTQSSDKSARVYKNADMKQEIKFFFLNQIKRNHLNEKSNANNLPVKEEYAEDKMLVDKEPMKKEKLNQNHLASYFFADESQCPSFFRRHVWSPDGSICLLAAGINKDENGDNMNVVWGFSRKDMSKPSFLLPTLDKSPTCIRFCPIIFEKDQDENKTTPELIDLPYKMVFAIGTLDSIFIYDTQDICPKFAITNIHYQPLTDLAWKGSSILAASSSDGYITFCIFEKEELGIPADPEKLPENAKLSYTTYLQVDPIKNILPVNYVTNIKPAKKKPNKNEENEHSLSNENSNNRSNTVSNIDVQSNSDANIDMNVNMNMGMTDNAKSSDIQEIKTTILEPQPQQQKRRIVPTILDK